MIAIDGVVVTDAMREAGTEIASLCMDAIVQHSFGGLGGSTEFDISNFPSKYHRLIAKYVEHEITSVEVIYIAMTMAKEHE